MIRFFMAVILSLIALIAIFHVDSDASSIHLRYAYAGMSSEHWLGTDALGRDLLSRLLIATKYSLIIAFSASFLSTMIGSMIGVVSAFRPGFFDHFNLYLFELLMSIPYIPLMMILMGFQLTYMNMGYEFSLSFYILILAVISWPPTMKVIRGKALVLKQEEFVKSAYAIGITKRQFLTNVVCKNLSPTLRLQFAISFGQFLVIESVLSYLGLGVQSPYISLGTLIQEYQAVFIAHAALLLYPCSIVFALTYVVHYLARKKGGKTVNNK